MMPLANCAICRYFIKTLTKQQSILPIPSVIQKQHLILLDS